jgi:hypothetical protein
MKHQIKIRRDGTIECLGELPFKTENKTRTRFSEIVPANWFLCLAFRTIRFIFGEGKWLIPEWTRQWKCEWRATILMGPTKGFSVTSQSRAALIDWENMMWYKPKFYL